MKWKLPVIFAGIGAAIFGLFSGQKPTPEPAPGPGPGPVNPKAPPWNPPAPGPSLLQKEVTPEMTSWAQSLIASGAPMHSLHPKTFGDVAVIGRLEWHTLQARTGKHGLFRSVGIYRGQGGVA